MKYSSVIFGLITALVFCCLGILKANAQEEGREYVPFVEEGKAWYCGYWHPHEVFPSTFEDIDGEGIDCIFTMLGDTLINDKEYKKVYCQFEEFYGDGEQHYYCAVREEEFRVFIVEENNIEEKQLYDFSHPGELITLSYNDYVFARTEGWRRYDFLPGQLNYKIYKYTGDESDSNYFNLWVDGVGSPYANPFSFEFSDFLYDELKFGTNISVRSCIKDGKYVFCAYWMAHSNPQDEQQYDSLLDEGKVWTIRSVSSDLNATVWIEECKLEDSSMIDGLTYKRLYERYRLEGEDSWTEWKAGAYIGQDDKGMVYYYQDYGYSKEKVITMDFSLQEGDLYCLDNGCSEYYVTAVSDTILENSTDKKLRKCIHLSRIVNGEIMYEDYNCDIWIEGIGSVKYGLIGMYGDMPGGSSRLIKCTQQENVIYQYDDATSSVHNIVRQIEDDNKYIDLQGRRLDSQSRNKGIYIQNGKKVVVK